MTVILKKRWFWLTTVPVAVVALAAGVAQAMPGTSGVLNLCIESNVVRAIDTGAACKAKEQSLEVYTKSGTDAAIAAVGGSSNADTLDNLDSTDFIRDGDSIDAATLSGQSASSFAPTAHTHDDRYYTESEADASFLGIEATAADAEKLDGLDSTAFAVKGTLSVGLTAEVPSFNCMTVETETGFPQAAGTYLASPYAPSLPAGVFIRGARIFTEDVITWDVCNLTASLVTISNAPVDFITFH